MFTLALPLDYYEDCDLNLGCERAASCEAFCLNQARNLLDPTNNNGQLSQASRDMACKLIAPNQSLTGTAEGLSLHSVWKYGQCSRGQNVVMESVCCAKRCMCAIFGQKVNDDDGEEMQILWDLSGQIDLGSLAYDCEESEFNDCERKCRQLVGERLEDEKIKSMFIRDNPSYNLFGKTKSLVASSRVCSEGGETVIGHYDVFVKVATDLEKFSKTGKFLPLGNLCCRRKCKCELLRQNALTVSSGVRQKSELLIDLSDLLSEGKLSYECSRSREVCIRDCRQALGEFFQSDLIRNNSTAIDWLTTDLDVFSENVSGVRVCEKIQQDLKPPGVNVYLRARIVGEEDFPSVEDIHVGRICCFPFIGK